ncbi:T9SS type A sorting domain-containing protein [Dyadobacter sandarakinus]|uniref:T9SS type A sorting domain-containing protein n=1 Tax=Dyadobacter sandarakinus TaxID=2747268 RepID=A0ABX7ICB5_9BACT|nr:T9SS type A sorting domain-containing protein [Dyadobacter sandarakinus]QRR03172.1 T9SS type A sorting domain-containing protein [Dyadobacter sandarakinus]
MKKYWITILSLGLSWNTFAQTPAFYNNGAGVFISTGTQLQVNGDLLNQEGSNFENLGVITTSGNVTNFAPMNEANAGDLHLEGSTPQVIGGASLYATHVTVNNAAGITFTTPVKVSDSLSFISGMLINSDLANAFVFGPGASISTLFPPSDAKHINGFVAREGSGTFVFPVGNGLSYQPVGVNLSANSAGLVARYEAGDAGDAPFGSGGSNSTPLIARNAQEYWSLTPVGTATGSVSIYWDEYNNTGIGNIADLAVAHLVNGNWLNEGANNASGIVNAGIVTSNNISTWSPFTLGSTAASSPLPVRLTDFTARWTEGSVALDWRVSDAKGFSHFEVERSLDAVQYDQVGRVAYDGQSVFRFADYSPLAPSWLAGQRYYRLKMIDKDGTFAYSKVRSVHVDGSENGLVAYPNPSHDVLHLSLHAADQDKVQATFIAMSGKAQTKKTIAIRQGKAVLDTSSLTPGVYLLSVQVDGYDKVLKFVKQ